MYWNSYVWIATGAGIKKVTPGLVSDVGTDQNDGLPSGYQGCIFDMIGLSDWMVYCVNGGTSDKSSIIKRHGTVGGNQQVYTSEVNKPIACLNYSPSSQYTNGRLWWGEGTDIKYCMFPDFNADPTEITNYEFTLQSGKGVLSTFRPLASFPKLAIKVMAVTKDCDTNKKITIHYKIDNDASWTELGAFTASPVPTALDFDSGAGKVFRTITFGVGLCTDDEKVTPELKSLDFAYLPSTKRLRGFTFNMVANQHNAEAILENLRTSQDKDTLLKFYPSGDSNEDVFYVRITNLPEQLHWDASRMEGTVTVSLEEIFR
jgi:hypothetical protein